MCTYVFRAAQGAQVLERGGGSVCPLNSAEFDADVNMLCLETILEVSLLHSLAFACSAVATSAQPCKHSLYY